MRRLLRPVSQKQPRRQGLSLIEVIVSTLLVGFVCVGAMRCLGSVVRGQMNCADSVRAKHLAQLLLTEIVNGAYEDEGTSPLFGPESGEETGNRSALDDVDDYHGWVASPPQDRDGSELPDLTSWQREVTVDFVTPADLASVSGTDQGVKRITVTVQRNGVVIGQQVSLRSNSYTTP